MSRLLPNSPGTIEVSRAAFAHGVVGLARQMQRVNVARLRARRRTTKRRALRRRLETHRARRLTWKYTPRVPIDDITCTVNRMAVINGVLATKFDSRKHATEILMPDTTRPPTWAGNYPSVTFRMKGGNACVYPAGKTMLMGKHMYELAPEILTRFSARAAEIERKTTNSLSSGLQHTANDGDNDE